MKKLLCLFVAMSLTVSGCASVYTGPKPDLTLKGPAAAEEAKRFQMSERYMEQGPWLVMGPEKTRYTLKSIAPVVESVSPSASIQLEEASRWRTIQRVLADATIAGLLLSIAIADRTTSLAFLGTSIVAMGGAITLGFVVPGLMGATARQYNRDLNEKLVPGVGINKTF